VVLIVLGKWFELFLENDFHYSWQVVLIVSGKWFELSLESGLNCFGKWV
jgi:hypothetical protein